MNKTQLAGGVLLNQNGDILLLHRNTEEFDHWEVPGGKIDAGETAQITAGRELKEELDVEVEVGDAIATAEFEDHGRMFVSTWFRVTTSQQPRVAEPETFSECQYVSLADLETGQLPLSVGVQTLLGLVKSGHVSL
ncbi:NUDIX hydrolase [Candidatus Saccharibacteria bacterium]|nr:NUDIX hydrolase [Candidatus Saccharibacteria bacterium]